MSADEDILRTLTIDGPQSAGQLLLRFTPRYRRVEITRALRRLRYAGKARCNVTRPCTHWHATTTHSATARGED